MYPHSDCSESVWRGTGAPTSSNELLRAAAALPTALLYGRTTDASPASSVAGTVGGPDLQEKQPKQKLLEPHFPGVAPAGPSVAV